jgi:hypothetical protein
MAKGDDGKKGLGESEAPPTNDAQKRLDALLSSLGGLTLQLKATNDEKLLLAADVITEMAKSPEEQVTKEKEDEKPKTAKVLGQELVMLHAATNGFENKLSTAETKLARLKQELEAAAEEREDIKQELDVHKQKVIDITKATDEKREQERLDKQVKIIVPKDAVPVPDSPHAAVVKPPVYVNPFPHLFPMELDGGFEEDDDDEQLGHKKDVLMGQLMESVEVARLQAQRRVDDLLAAASAKRRKGIDGLAEKKNEAGEALQEAKDKLPSKEALLAAAGTVGEDTKCG